MAGSDWPETAFGEWMEQSWLSKGAFEGGGRLATDGFPKEAFRKWLSEAFFRESFFRQPLFEKELSESNFPRPVSG